MMTQSLYKKVVCFDLDDTLYKEIDFVRSAYREIADYVGRPELLEIMLNWYVSGENTFQKLNQTLGLGISISEYLSIYRNHRPAIDLSDGVEKTLEELSSIGCVLGLITDGRSVSQRNKIDALGLYRWFENRNIIISAEFGSEKTDKRNYMYFMELYPNRSYIYVGDNPQKDFASANRLGWETVMIKDDGRNIHRQYTMQNVCLPQVTINRFENLIHFVR